LRHLKNRKKSEQFKPSFFLNSQMERGNGRRAARFQISGGVSMKKLISILVVFALAATVVFAREGSWSVGGGGEISTIFNFVPKESDFDPTADDDPQPTVGVHAYNNYGYYGSSTGSLSATYSNGDVSAGLSFDLADKILANVSYDSGDIAFAAESDVFSLLSGDAFDNAVGRLWGYYKFLDGAIHLEVAMRSRDTNYWISNEVVAHVFDAAPDGPNAAFGIGSGFMSVDGHNYLLADFNLSSLVDGLSLGFMLPRVFNFLDGATYFPNPWDDSKWTDGTLVSDFDGSGNTLPGMHAVGYGTFATVKEVFQMLRFGVKYASGPIDAAVQFALLGHATDPDKVNSGLYFGANYSINDQMKAGIGLQGHFNGDSSDDNQFAFAANFSYGDGPFSAGVEGGLFFANSDDKGLLGLRPKVSYNIVDNYLNFTLDALLLFNLDSDLADSSGMYYEITPELSFNVMGTGAGQGYYWPNATAIILRYKLAGWTKNAGDDADAYYSALDITFKWSF
jgi:hypothetical protein